MKKLNIETYGCQMNIADSEVVASILAEHFEITENQKEADLILLNTCSVRDNAEQRIRKRLRELGSLKKKKSTLIIGLLGCMAERVKEQLLTEEKALDFIAGPDAYRSLPQLIEEASKGNLSFNVLLSEEETYDDIAPVRYDGNGISAFIPIMRGCNNFCSYCIVPYTRGRERSRDPKTIIQEATQLFESGYKEITLLGQNVNSYLWKEDESSLDFADLIEKMALISPLLRVRFATSHPKDISDKLIYTIAKYPNICKYIHLPVQSGSTAVLKKMNRVYNREYYLERIRTIKNVIPDIALSTDILSGFCGETEQDHQDTLSIMKTVEFSSAFMFRYSVREGTKAAEKFEDDVPDEVKARRLEEIIALQQELSLENNKKDIGKVFEVLVEGVSKRSDKKMYGRTSQNKVCVFPREETKVGDYIHVNVIHCTAGTLLAEIVQ
ncbi:MAG TPA: tRNA (N6-isopentenyl adenosine(37)-C2)-methylthiotransferase MiaB [Bacteroidales bacterium]|nr:tRNA (N6-isopentenyl adenosine(37)-C2)-methylthiotransferase MiaB [Bacteroidales bacterium]HPS71330.1 tRNA (N6-isopentenyl adenosine(37)-C2)-methylthiotransferase MiaB [Bacteroidales bacterium]